MGKRNGLIVKVGMMFMVQTIVSAEIPMVVVVEIDSNSHWTLVVRSWRLLTASMYCIFNVFLFNTMFSYDGIILNNGLFLWLRTHGISACADICIWICIKQVDKLVHLNLWNNFTQIIYIKTKQNRTKNINGITFKRIRSFHMFMMFCHHITWSNIVT